MTKHSSATTRGQSPHGTEQRPNTTRTATILNALKRRAQAVLNDTSIDPQTRNIVRYGLETNDPWLAELVRCAESRESIETIDFSQTPSGRIKSRAPAIITGPLSLTTNSPILFS